MTTSADVRTGFPSSWAARRRARPAELRHAASWRQAVLAEARRLELALSELPAEAPVRTGVGKQLAIARDAAAEPMRLLDWWHGTLHERAWPALHEAEALLVGALPAEHAAVWWLNATGATQKPRAPWETLGKHDLSERTTYAIAHSLRRYYDDSDRLYDEERSFRNRLIRLTGIGLVAAVLLFVAGTAGWLRVTSGSKAPVVVHGWREFALVSLFGMLGAYVTSLPALSRAPSRRTPFQLPMHQLMLKLVVGPVFALLGVLAIQGGFVSQTKPLDEFGLSLLLWAAVLGGGQQAVTGVFDRKAASIADAAPQPPHAMHPTA